MKIGRNDPCPCGSGKKYKKCCINKMESASLSRIKLPNKLWQPEDVEEMDTDMIVAYLQTYGIHLNEKEMASTIKSFGTAEDVTLRWIDDFQLDTRDRMIDFTFLAIKVLATRLTPEHILLEHLDGLINEGYRHDKGYFDEDAADVWEKAWNKLLVWLKDNPVTSLDVLDKLARRSMINLFSDWIGDYVTALQNAGRYNKDYHLKSIKFVDELLEKLPNSDTRMINKAITLKGEGLFKLGERDKADRLFEDYVSHQSDQFDVYFEWANLYNPELGSIAEDKEKSIQLYRKALDCAGSDWDREVAKDWLYELMN